MNGIKNINIDEAKPEELRAYAQNFLNLELDTNASDAQVRAAIDRAQPGIKLIFAVDTPAPAVPPPAENEPVPEELLRPEEKSGKQAGSLGKDDPRWIINIPVVETDDASGTRDVVVGINGRGWQIARGHDVNVPHRVAHALLNAESIKVTHQDDGKGDVDVIISKAKRFPFQIISKPTDAEIAEWDRRVGAEFCA